MSTTRSSPNFGPLFIATAATLWTTDFISRGILLGNGMLPVHIVTLEHIILVLVLSPFLFRFLPKLKEFTTKEKIAITIIGGGASALATVSLTAGYGLNFFVYGPIVALTQQFQPVVAIGLASVLLKERLPRHYYLLSIVAILGVLGMYWPVVSLLAISGQLIEIQTGLLAAFFGLSAAILWGSGTVLGNYLLVHSETKISYFEMVNFRFMIGMVFLVIASVLFTPFGEGIALLGDFENLGSLLYIALVPGLLSMLLYYFGLKSTHASVATLFELAFPLSFIVVIPLIFQEAQIAPIQYAGAALLIISTTILSIKYSKESEVIAEEST